MIKISSLEKNNNCYISLYYNITIVIFKCFDEKLKKLKDKKQEQRL